MIKNYIRSSIIVLIKAILPIIALLTLAPWIINTNLFAYWRHAFANIQPSFLVLHGLLYLALILLWPKLIARKKIQNQPTPEELNIALKIRWYLLAIFLFIDVLMIWKML